MGLKADCLRMLERMPLAPAAMDIKGEESSQEATVFVICVAGTWRI